VPAANVLRIVLAVLAGVAITGAVVLSALDKDSAEAWAAGLAIVGLLAGQHLEKPTGSA
jgi:hypothetical protein